LVQLQTILSSTQEDFDNFLQLREKLYEFLWSGYRQYAQYFSIRGEKFIDKIKNIDRDSIRFYGERYFSNGDCDYGECDIPTKFFFDKEFNQKMIEDQKKKNIEYQQKQLELKQEQLLKKQKEELDLFNKLKEK
jgi:hypothetical protein